MRIAVMGSGGVGGYFGGALARAGEEVIFIARGEHLKAMLEQSLKVESTLGNFDISISPLTTKMTPSLPAPSSVPHPSAWATGDPDKIGRVDLILFCVKTYDTEDASRAIFPLVGFSTAILPLQNGIDSADKLGRDHGRNHVLGGAAYIYASISRPGVIQHSGCPRKILFGELDGSRSDRAQRYQEAFTRAGIPSEISSNIRKTLWEKFAMICANGGMSALTRATLGEMLAHAQTRTMLERAMREVVQVGVKEGVPFDPDFVERTMKFMETLEPGGRASLYWDLIQQRRMELQSLNGKVVRLAEKHGLRVPMNFAVYAALLPHLK